MVIKGQLGAVCPPLEEALKDDWEPVGFSIRNDQIHYMVRKQVWATVTVELVGEPALGHTVYEEQTPDLVIPSLSELQDKLKKEPVKRGKKAR